MDYCDGKVTCCAYKLCLKSQIVCFILVALSSWVSQLVHSLCRSHFSQEWQGVCTHTDTLWWMCHFYGQVSVSGSFECCGWQACQNTAMQSSCTVLLVQGFRWVWSSPNDRWTDPDEDWQNVWLNLSVEVVKQLWLSWSHVSIKPSQTLYRAVNATH